MTNINERLDKLRIIIQQDDFLEGKGLSNEVNIQMFCYDPKDEMIIRHYLKQICSMQLNCNIIHYDLYELFLKSCEEKRVLRQIPKLEERKGKEFVKKQLANIFDAKTIASNMQYDNHKIGDVIVLSGIGKVFPFMRVHTLLEAMQPLFNDVPILVFYPGKFDGHQVKLFNKLKPNEYYRAFNLL